MSTNMIKDLFNQKKYDEVIDMLKYLYVDLYHDMLDYKNQKYDGKEDNYDYLSVLIRNNYPQFKDDLIHLSVLYSEPDTSYLDQINSLLSTYMFMKKQYKNSQFESNFLNSENVEDELL